MHRLVRTGLTVAVLAVVTVVGLAAVAAREDAAAPTAAVPSMAAAAPREPLLAADTAGPEPTTAGLAAALAPVLADPALGRPVAVSVLDAVTGVSLWDRLGATPVLPASTAKIVTAVAALSGLPPQLRLTTRAVAGPLPGEVVLVGGGDVTLAGPAARAPVGPATSAPARLADLAAQTRTALAGASVTRVLVDDSAYAGPATGPSWKPGYLVADVAPVSALSIDGGRAGPARDARVADPALAAGQAFAQLLGVPAGAVLRGTAPSGAATLATVQSPPLPDLVEQMLTDSNNDLAESLAHRLALARGLPATFAGGAQATAQALTGLVPAGAVTLVDGSGLSTDDRVQPAAVAALLARLVRDATGRFGAVLSGLPVAGFDGTLQDRFRQGPVVPAAGEVRAKTGTLLGVGALAGLVRTADGRLLAFDITLNAVPMAGTRAAEAALDRIASALAACGCR